jgi:NAD(P)-dependent dehydrogenase (short-subunit alcohol dehydrogenase family)
VSASGETTAPIALVTAGARRLGKAMILRLAELGHDIALHYNTSENDAKKTAAEVQALGRRCFTFQRDFTNISEVQTLIGEVKQKMGAPTLLINSASAFIKNKLTTATEAQFDLDFALHVKVPFFLSQAFARECGRGMIVNMVDTNVTRCHTDYFSYLLSKKALFELTRMSANELAPNIRVNCIAPGLMMQPVGVDKQVYENAAEGNLLRRRLDPINVVAALEYLVKNDVITGECLFVDAGDQVKY